MTTSNELLQRAQIALLRESLEQGPDEQESRETLAAASSLVHFVRRIASEPGAHAGENADEMMAAAVVLWLTGRPRDAANESFVAFEASREYAVEHAIGLSS